MTKYIFKVGFSDGEEEVWVIANDMSHAIMILKSTYVSALWSYPISEEATSEDIGIEALEGRSQ